MLGAEITPISREVFVANKGKVLIKGELCKGCYYCILACPMNLLEKDTKPNSTGIYPAVPVGQELSKCIACGNCYQVCPDVAIQVFEIDA